MEVVDAQIHNLPPGIDSPDIQRQPPPVVDFEARLDPELRVRTAAVIALSAMKAVGVDAAVFYHPQPLTLAELESQMIPAIHAGLFYPGRFGGVVTPDPDRVLDIESFLRGCPDTARSSSRDYTRGASTIGSRPPSNIGFRLA